MVENIENELTADEAELYDRQIRLWGLDSQKRLRASRVLIAGVNGFGAEIAKNIILSGVKALTLLDDSIITEEDGCSQFLAPTAALKQNRAEASIQRARALNPMVEITADTDPLSSKSSNFFETFDVVVVTGANSTELIRIDQICRVKNIKFFSGDVWGMFGYSFADLVDHDFVEDVVKHKIVSKPHEKVKTELITSTVKRNLKFPPFKNVVEFDYKSATYLKKIKRSGPAFIVFRILQEFRDRMQRDPSYLERANDIKQLHKIRDELVDDSIEIPDSSFEHVFSQISPATAIVGGELAQEIIKAVSQKEAPHLNVFLFDPEKCCGFIQAIGED